MRIKAKESTISRFKNLIDAILLDEKMNIIIIREVEYEKVVEKPKPKKSYFIRSSEDSKPKTNYYITKLKIEGYNSNLKFIGIYQEDYLKRLISYDEYYDSNVSIIQWRDNWEKLVTKLKAFNIDVIINKTQYCSMAGKGYCPHEYEDGKCDYKDTCTNKLEEKPKEIESQDDLLDKTN